MQRRTRKKAGEKPADDAPAAEVAASPRPATDHGPCVVGIGASAGGLDSLTKLFSHLPHDTGLVFVVIQHLSPDHESLLPELIGRSTSKPRFLLTSMAPAARQP